MFFEGSLEGKDAYCDGVVVVSRHRVGSMFISDW